MELCLACGLCCDGTLYDRVAVAPEEAARLRARRLPILDDGHLPQPCAAHDGRCTVYEDRPQRCANYECDVLVDLAAGAMTDVEAATLVAKTRALVTSVRARIPGRAFLWRDVADASQDSVAWRREHADLLLDVALLRRLLGRFRAFEDGPTQPGVTAGG